MAQPADGQGFPLKPGYKILLFEHVAVQNFDADIAI
jgi:hypothetical protein